jgi:hypothetical protein
MTWPPQSRRGDPANLGSNATYTIIYANTLKSYEASDNPLYVELPDNLYLRNSVEVSKLSKLAAAKEDVFATGE